MDKKLDCEGDVGGTLDMMDRGQEGAPISRRPCLRPNTPPMNVSDIHGRLRGKSDTNIVALRPAVCIHVFEKHGDLLPQHAKRPLGICIQGALNVIHVRKTTSARVPADCTNIRVTLPESWKTEWMSAVAVFSGRPI